MANDQFDAIIVGAGFAGIYQLYRLRKQGLNCLLIDEAGDVGGTWYHNQYPGAMSDTESYTYRYSWDRDDLLTYPFKETYMKGPEILAYLEHVVERHDLRKSMRFSTLLCAASWDDTDKIWNLTVSGEKKLRTRYLVLALGILSKTNIPRFPGLESFKGELYHTGKWPREASMEGKRVGVIGNGSTGVQIITELGRKVQSLTSFQRHPQYSVPSGDKAVTSEYRQHINANWDRTWDYIHNHSVTGFGFAESQQSFHDATPEEREQIFQKAWDQGNGFRFMFGTFNDISIDADANEGACQFIRDKIDEIVKDPEKARKLKPYDLYARRPLCDGNAHNGQKYFEQFNRDNVDIVAIQETPIVQFEPEGIRTSDGKLHELDVVIFATGFDAIDGNFKRIDLQGRDGLSLAEAWEKDGPTSYLAMAMPGFPNLFMAPGPKVPFTNMPPAIEVVVNLISDVVAHAEKTQRCVVEPTKEAEQEYAEACVQAASRSLFWKATDNWIFGANIPGKKRSLNFWLGGLAAYNKRVAEMMANDFYGFTFL